ncbi:putative F-box domain, leucine-rich repeat domain superfamily, F-box-like domain superfamily [Helianthus anomalus]
MECDTVRMDDRLSGLPDDLLLKILSFVGLKDVIGTSVLSSRWRYLSTSIPRLIFSSHDFSTMDKLSDFVTHVLSRRNDQVRLSSFKLYLHGEHAHDVAQRIMNHAFSLNVHGVKFKCLLETCQWYMPKVDFPLSLSGSQTLKRLTSIWGSRPCEEIVLTSAHEFSSLRGGGVGENLPVINKVHE